MVGQFETIEYPVAVRDRTIRLLGPKDPYSHYLTPEMRRRSREEGYTPYWTTPWPAARMLGEYLIDHVSPPAHTVLELGAGLGLAGLITAAFGYRMLMTDYDVEALEFVRASAALNGIEIEEPRMLDWRNPPAERYQMIVAADVLYEKSNMPRVVAVLRECLAEDGRAYITDTHRESVNGVIPLLDREGFSYETIPVECRAIPRPGSIDGRTFRGRVFRIWRD